MTRSKTDTKCDCRICVIGRMNGIEYKLYEKEQSNKPGRIKVTSNTPPAKKLPLCSKCYGLVTRGVTHVCNKTNKRENLANFVRTSSGNTKSKVTCDVLKSLCTDQGASTSGGSVSLVTGGKPLPVTVGRAPLAVKKPRFSLDSLKRLQTSINLSDRQTL